MTFAKKFLRASLFGLLLFTTPAAAQPQQPPAQPSSQPSAPAARDEFVPVTDLPDSEKLPAAPYLIAAYSIVWLVLLGYVWSIWRRLSQVEAELKQAVRDHA
jgi:CcmD family protein